MILTFFKSVGEVICFIAAVLLDNDFVTDCVIRSPRNHFFLFFEK